MNIYAAPNAAMEDLVNAIQELRPGMVTSRLVLEISTDDKGLAALLKRISDDIPDEMNADSLVLPRSKPEKKARKPRISKAPVEISSIGGDGFRD